MPVSTVVGSVWAMGQNEFAPGSLAPRSGLFEEVNVLGTPTGVITVQDEGEPFPGAPRGFMWRPLAELSASHLRAQAARYRRMAATATTEPVMASLLRVAERLEATADLRAKRLR